MLHTANEGLGLCSNEECSHVEQPQCENNEGGNCHVFTHVTTGLGFKVRKNMS